MQNKEPDEFRESTSIFQIWLRFRQNTIALFSFYLLIALILPHFLLVILHLMLIIDNLLGKN